MLSGIIDFYQGAVSWKQEHNILLDPLKILIPDLIHWWRQMHKYFINFRIWFPHFPGSGFTYAVEAENCITACKGMKKWQSLWWPASKSHFLCIAMGAYVTTCPACAKAHPNLAVREFCSKINSKNHIISIWAIYQELAESHICGSASSAKQGLLQDFGNSEGKEKTSDPSVTKKCLLAGTTSRLRRTGARNKNKPCLLSSTLRKDFQSCGIGVSAITLIGSQVLPSALLFLSDDLNVLDRYTS